MILEEESAKVFHYLADIGVMDSAANSIDKILEEFLKSEMKSTDNRILSIRHFMEILTVEIDRYKENDQKMNKRVLVELVDDMVKMYEEEIKILVFKRNRIQKHLTSIHIAMSNYGSNVADNNHSPFYLN